MDHDWEPKFVKTEGVVVRISLMSRCKIGTIGFGEYDTTFVASRDIRLTDLSYQHCVSIND
jgi:hypothetical protein